MATFNQLKSDIFGAVEPELERLGFKPKGRDGTFVRQQRPGVSHGYLVLINKSEPFAKVDVHLFVRIDQVEDIFHRTSGYEPKYQRDTPTMGGALDGITGDSRFRLLLDDKRGPTIARETLFSAAIVELYADWYQRFSELEGIDHELNDDPSRQSPSRPLPWLRCSTAIIVASLIRRQDFQDLARGYSDVLQQVNNGFYLPRFQALLADLQESMS